MKFVHRLLARKPDLVILSIAGGLVLFGLIALSSAAGPLGYARFGDTYFFLKGAVRLPG